MKSQIINIRVSQSLKEDLDLLCMIKDKNISELTRVALKIYVEEEKYSDKDIDMSNPGIDMSY